MAPHTHIHTPHASHNKHHTTRIGKKGRGGEGRERQGNWLGGGGGGQTEGCVNGLEVFQMREVDLEWVHDPRPHCDGHQFCDHFPHLPSRVRLPHAPAHARKRAYVWKRA